MAGPSEDEDAEPQAEEPELEKAIGDMVQELGRAPRGALRFHRERLEGRQARNIAPPGLMLHEGGVHYKEWEVWSDVLPGDGEVVPGAIDAFAASWLAQSLNWIQMFRQSPIPLRVWVLALGHPKADSPPFPLSLPPSPLLFPALECLEYLVVTRVLNRSLGAVLRSSVGKGVRVDRRGVGGGVSTLVGGSASDFCLS